jgi:tetratricopeptide (TPR) repeat protein
MRDLKKRGPTPPESQSCLRRHLIVAAGLCALTLLAYSNSFGAGFTMDNRGLLLEDPRIREATAQNLGSIFQHTYWWPYGESGLYRPFTTLTYLFNYAVLGNADQPAGYHWINLLLHAANVLLVYALGLRLLRRFWPAVLLAAVWAVHPVLTESVTNMVGRADLLAGMAVLGGFLMYLKSADATGARRWGWLAGLMAAATLGVFSKESAVTLLGVIALYELAWWKERRRTGALLLGCLAVAPAIEALLYQRAAVLANAPAVAIPFGDNPLTAASFWTAKLTALEVMARYLGLLAWPANLSCDYSYAQIAPAGGSPADWLAWAALAAVAGAVVAMYRWSRTAFFFAGMAFVTFLPTSNLLFPIGTIMAERFLYLPAIAMAACLVLGVCAAGERLGRAKAAWAVLSVAIAALAVRTWVRNADWQDDLSLANATVRSSPRSFKAHKMLAAALYESHGDIDQVTAEAEKSLAILNDVPDARNNGDSYRRAAAYYLDKGDRVRGTPPSVAAYHRSRELLERAAGIVRAMDRPAGEKNRWMADLDRSMVTVCSRLEDRECALSKAGEALALDPLAAESYGQMAAALAAVDRLDEAAVLLMEGGLLTGNARLRQGLVNLYREGLDPQSCALLPGGTSLNPSCAIVHRHLCAGSLGAIRVLEGAGQTESARKMKASAVQEFGCPAGR